MCAPGAETSLASGWSEHQTGDGRKFFYHEDRLRRRTPPLRGLPVDFAGWTQAVGVSYCWRSSVALRAWALGSPTGSDVRFLLGRSVAPRARAASDLARACALRRLALRRRARSRASPLLRAVRSKSEGECCALLNTEAEEKRLSQRCAGRCLRQHHPADDAAKMAKPGPKLSAEVCAPIRRPTFGQI